MDTEDHVWIRDLRPVLTWMFKKNSVHLILVITKKNEHLSLDQIIFYGGNYIFRTPPLFDSALAGPSTQI